MTIENPGTTDNGALSDVENKARQDMGQAKETLRSDLDAVSRRAAEDVDALKREAKGQIDSVTEQASQKVRSFASDQKNLATSQITGVASAISRVADELEGTEQATIGRYARDLANGLERFGREVDGKEPEDLMGMAQQFGRSQPLAFLGAAALAGFVASRFAGASAQRRQQSSPATSYTSSTTTQPAPTNLGASGNGTEFARQGQTYTGGQDVTG